MKKIPAISHYVLRYPICMCYPKDWKFTKRIKYFSDGKMELEIKFFEREYSFFRVFYKDVEKTKFMCYSNFIPVPVKPTETIIECTQ